MTFSPSHQLSAGTESHRAPRAAQPTPGCGRAPDVPFHEAPAQFNVVIPTQGPAVPSRGCCSDADGTPRAPSSVGSGRQPRSGPAASAQLARSAARGAWACHSKEPAGGFHTAARV